MKISVIIPVYNTKKYLPRCLESILNQSLKEIEIIVINDGSTDGSELIAEKYLEDSRVKLINKKNGGLSSARNVGIDNSIGEYILHIDSDDWIEKDYLKDMYNKAKKYNLDIVVSDIIIDWDNGRIKQKYMDIVFF